MEANKFDGWPSSSFLTLLICLQRSDNDTGGGDVSRIILYEPGGKVDLISVVFSRYLSCIPIAIKILLEAMNVQSSGMTSFKPLIWGGSQSCLCCETNSLIFVLKSSIE